MSENSGQQGGVRETAEFSHSVEWSYAWSDMNAFTAGAFEDRTLTDMAHAQGIATTDELERDGGGMGESSVAGEYRQKLPMAKSLPLLVIAAGLVGVLYWPTFAELVAVWNVDPNYSHGFVVPLASLLFALLAWKTVGIPIRDEVARKSVIVGLTEVALGFVVHLVGWLTANLFIDVLGLICIVRGLLLALGGTEVNKAYGFPVLFLIFMAPLPAAWYQPIAIVMQQLVSAVSTGLLETFGVPAYREGYLIYLADYRMEVGEACSGLRQLTAVLALSVAIGYSARKGPIYTWTLAALSVPIAITANCIRVVLTGVIMMLFGRKWAEGVFHTLEGLVIVALAAGLVVGAAWILVKIEQWFWGRKPSRTNSDKDSSGTNNVGDADPPPKTA